MIFKEDFVKEFTALQLTEAIRILHGVNASLDNAGQGAELRKLIGDASGLALEAYGKLTGKRNIYRR